MALTSADPILRCAAGEALGRMAQVIGDPKFISTMAQVIAQILKYLIECVKRDDL